MCAEITDGANVPDILQILACPGILLSTDQLGGPNRVWLVCLQSLCWCLFSGACGMDPVICSGRRMDSNLACVGLHVMLCISGVGHQ